MTVYVCPDRDIECGRNPSHWCRTCPQNAKFAPVRLSKWAEPTREHALWLADKLAGNDYVQEAAEMLRRWPEDANRAPYQELLYAVASKHPGETRHQTALRYIRQAEEHPVRAAAALSTGAQDE